MKKEKPILEKHTRKSISAGLRQFDFLAKDDDFIEVTQWTNGVGFDINISSQGEKYIAITDGEFKAIKEMIKQLNKE
jgi:hypothetical protein